MNRFFNGIHPYRLFGVFMCLMIYCLSSYRNSLVVYAAEVSEPPTSTTDEVDASTDSVNSDDIQTRAERYLQNDEPSREQGVYSISEDVHAIRVMAEMTYHCWFPLAFGIFLVFLIGTWIYRTFISPFL